MNENHHHTDPGADESIASSTPLIEEVTQLESKLPDECTSLNSTKKRKHENVTKLVAGISTGRWTESEHKFFLDGMKIHGRDWNRISNEFLTSRTSAQVRSHAQKYLTKIAKERSALEQNRKLRDDASSFVKEGMSSDSTAIIQRIIDCPETVEQEVEDVLKKLHERYRLLQKKLNEKKQKTQGAVAHSNLIDRKYHYHAQMEIVPEECDTIADSLENISFENGEWGATTANEEAHDEMIAVQLLSSGLCLTTETTHERQQRDQEHVGADEYGYHCDPHFEVEGAQNHHENGNHTNEIYFFQNHNTNPSSPINGSKKVSSTISFDSILESNDHMKEN